MKECLKMDSCCTPSTDKTIIPAICPACHNKGKGVQLITLKAMLKSSALETIHSEASYTFCSNPSCKVVYYSDLQSFDTSALKVPVFQKNDALDVPVCYCFGWTRERILSAIQEQQNPTDHIREQVQAKRCGCEVNNPQGSCCLGNVTAFIRSLEKS
jgi:Zinc binding domain